jgi:outer membrane murein-binding lipoprotein Lpp
MVVPMAEDRIPELETQIRTLQAQHAELGKQLIKARIEHWQGRIDDLEVQIHTGAVEASEKLTRNMDQLRCTWPETRKQWEAATSTAASAVDTAHTGVEDFDHERLAEKNVTAHTLRYTAAMRPVSAPTSTLRSSPPGDIRRLGYRGPALKRPGRGGRE